jgi:hypothetical protein
MGAAYLSFVAVFFRESIFFDILPVSSKALSLGAIRAQFEKRNADSTDTGVSDRSSGWQEFLLSQISRAAFEPE